jgi:hypothetical protein
VKRFEAAFKDAGIEFHKTRPARLLLNKMAAKPDGIITASTRGRFEKLFVLANARLRKMSDK